MKKGTILKLESDITHEKVNNRTCVQFLFSLPESEEPKTIHSYSYWLPIEVEIVQRERLNEETS